MGLVVVCGPRLIEHDDGEVPRLSRTNQSLQPKPAESSALPGGVQPVMAEKPPMALYRLIAEGLILKLKPGSLLLTFTEYETLANRTTDALYKKMGLVLPKPYLIPPALPLAWVNSPELASMEDFEKIRLLNAANNDYIKRIIERLVDEYSVATVSLLSEQFAAIRGVRKTGDASVAQFLKRLYGPDYLQAYILAHDASEIQKSSITGKREPIVVPPRLVADGEAEICGLWRTEFSDEELGAVHRFIVQHEIGEKLRNDLSRSTMPEAEKSLIESTVLGYRISSMHALTTTTAAVYYKRAKVGAN